MDEQVVKLAKETVARYRELTEELSDPAIFNDQRRYAEVAREHSRMRRGAELSERFLEALREEREARELIPAAESAEEREFFAGEAREAGRRAGELAEEIRSELIDRDPNDDKDVILEIRAGTGGDEAALFAGDLYEMYARYADRLGFRHRVLDASPAEVGGYKEIIVEIEGDGAYSVFKHEGGTHRVQRVPKTESQGRIHTSTATVAVLPEAEEVEVEINPNDLEIDVYRSSGPGGQSVNTTDSAVRITHKPTGLVVTCQNEKSQLQNKEQALRILRSRLLEREMRERQEREGQMRLAQFGSGDRSAKIRTYNFPQGRITDHRVGLTVHNLEAVLGGELEEFTKALAAKERADRLAASATGSPG
ncbi:bacterial peptide chain release factor 1 (bRF-1) [Rubrobacter xylanophilus DSM 9941]|uniref:Peptide chain release factor 1 n=1 Tax=Rubrobacter xylanophilus (strain DSM 9941 / JCM 11954 / NBRC 16129 / PRD-1) TaxID=266117 RepID=RF1_RUBXD|nr:peptide chain release factor 1 [Rubrobacter xylanophilus]Q1AVG5.1 RecName: Full=Peptide chain release factor 1; Short=RF-1 [Rubrobacter xylanophilus DSM 9941]ABG04613.1 bacterial peptide chain release factor 1 (bRF-1) [Rubrobacter xylanophilus DSM 9941]